MRREATASLILFCILSLCATYCGVHPDATECIAICNSQVQEYSITGCTCFEPGDTP